MFANQEKYTDSEGKAYFTGLTEGTKYFFIEADNFIDTSGYVFVPENDINHIINLHLQKTILLELLIYEELGVVDSALVQINGMSAYTNEFGLVEFSKLFPENFVLSIDKTGYKPYSSMLTIPDCNFYVELEISPKTYSAIFNVLYNNSKVSDATVLVKDNIYLTSMQGQAVVNHLRSENGILYEVRHLEYEDKRGCFNVANQNVELFVDLQPLGVDLFKNNDTEVYPNPSNGIFNVKIQESLIPQQIVVYNMSGKEIIRKTASHKNKIKLTNVQKGMYLLKVICKNYVFTHIIRIK